MINKQKHYYVEDDIMANEQIKFSERDEGKLKILRELSSYIINSGKSTINKTEMFRWIDSQKKEIKAVDNGKDSS